MLKPRIQPDSNDKVTFTESKWVESNKTLTEEYEKLTIPELGLKEAINVYEPLCARYNKDVKDLDPVKKTKLAMLCNTFIQETMRRENVVDWSALNETSRADIPKWVKNGLALISCGYAEDLTDLVISEQPMSSRTSRIHYMDIKTEKSKGRVPEGQRIFDALRGFNGDDEVSNHEIKNEAVGSAGATDYQHTCPYVPIIPDSIRITDGNQVIECDRNGNLVGNVGTPSGIYNNKVNYITGLMGFVFAASTTGPVTVTYAYNIEVAALEVLPRYGIALRSIEITAIPRAISAFWSQQSVFDFMNDFGVDAEPTILDAGGKIIMAEKFKHISKHLYNSANGGTMVFDNRNPTGIDYQQHIDSFGILLTRLQNEIWQNTQRVRPNRMIHSPDIWFLLQYTKGFQAEGGPGQTDALAGPKKSGTLTNHNITCVCDPTFPPRSGVLTYRGDEMTNTAAVCANYIPIYRAPIHQKGFHKDTALLTEYALHNVNTEMMGRIEVTNL